MDKIRMKKVGIYARVSTNKKGEGRQEVENQLIQLRDYCVRQGWEVHKEYVDHQSGGKANREGLTKLFEDASKREFDLVLFWALDRFSREGVLPTLEKLQLLNHYGIEFASYTEAYLNSTGAFKDAVIGILATISKQERVRQTERVKAGLERAKKSGKVLGRKPIPDEVVKEVKRLRTEENLTVRAIADKVGLGRSSVGRIIKQTKGGNSES